MLSGIWQFLNDPSNQGTLALLGGGAVVVVGGLWKAVTFFLDGTKPAAPQPSTTVTVQTPVIINPDAKDVVAPIKEQVEQLAAQVAREKGVEVVPLRRVLDKLGEKGVPEEDIPKRLEAAADELIKFR